VRDFLLTGAHGKKDGRLERFDLNKIVRGLQKTCEKRPVSMEQIHVLAERVRQDLTMLYKAQAQDDWRVRENSNMSYSLQGLNNYLSSTVVAKYWIKII
jgi:hypothetical protein